MLKAEDMVFHRGEDGDLLPQEVILETLKEKGTIKARPITRGKLMEIYQKATSNDMQDKIKADSDIIKQGLIDPKLTDEQIADLKPLYANAVSTAIMAVSLGVSQQKVEEKAKELIENQEEELKKNLIPKVT